MNDRARSHGGQAYDTRWPFAINWFFVCGVAHGKTWHGPVPPRESKIELVDVGATPTFWSGEKVDLVIEFHTDEQVAPIVAAKYREANIPLIAVEVPHPGATYFDASRPLPA